MPLGTLGKYERLDVLGHGVSGIVYLARDTLLNKQVALKEVDVQSADVRRFLEEARVMDRLRHPNIVRVNGVDRIEGKIVIDMEYVRGQNLQELLRAEGPLPIDRAVEIAEQIVDALAYAHGMNTVHRDIKPANVLIGRDGAVKLADFGLAEILATNSYAGGAGTYAFMAPEDFAEDDRSDHQSDIWAVGVSLFEMLTGNRPFQVAKVKDPFAWKRALETDRPVALSEYLPGAPPALQAIMDHVLERDKRKRYRSAEEFRDDIARFRAGAPVSRATLEISAAMAAERALKPQPHVNAVCEEWAPTEAAVRGDGLGVVVAEVRNDDSTNRSDRAPSKRDRRSPLLRARPTAHPVMSVVPGAVDFGTVRKGETPSVKLRVNVRNAAGPMQGQVIFKPGWLMATPALFESSRQTIRLTAATDQVWEVGEFSDTVRFQSVAGETDVPVRVRVLKARPTFGQVAPWFLPLFGAVMLPAAAVATAAAGQNTGYSAIAGIAPASAAASGLLALMLLLIGIAADIGTTERTACGLVMATMCFVLGVVAARAHGPQLAAGLQGAALTATIVGVPLVLQVLAPSRWKLWAVVLFGLGLFLGGVFLRALVSV